jgi:murein DD-endopeptidase MepM/ murein hydrolase activator NlpD
MYKAPRFFISLYLCLFFGLLSSCTQPTFKSSLDNFESPTFNHKLKKIPKADSKPRSHFSPFALEWPVQKVKISQHFNPKKRRRPHQGLDLTQHRDAPILAAHTGHIVYSGSGYRGYGNMVIVKFNDTWSTLYAHLNKIMVS